MPAGSRHMLLIASVVLASSVVVASPAAARTAYSVDQDANQVTPIETATGAAGAPIQVGLAPPQAAISPDGAVLYVLDDTAPMGSIRNISTATNTVTRTIPLVRATNIGGGGLHGAAVTPDGAAIYAAWPDNGTVEVLSTETDEFVASIPVDMAPFGIAVTPDGGTVYAAGGDQLSVISTATNTVVGTVALAGPWRIAVSPDGNRVYVSQSGRNALAVVDTEKNEVVATVPVGSWPDEVAVSPDGATALVSTMDNSVSVVSTVRNRVVATIPTPGRPSGIAFAPGGRTAYVTIIDRNAVIPIDTATNRVGAEIPVGKWPRMVALVPNQPPHAAFAVTDAAAPVRFDASASSDPDGSVRRYRWDFGDGADTTTTSPTTTHAYATAGEYEVTLRVTDDEGCSAQLLFTGQTATCNGSAVARATQLITVAAGAEPTRGGVGYRVCSTARRVSTQVLEAESGFTNALRILAPRRRSLGLDSDTGTTSELGTFTQGRELVLGIRVRETGDLFRTGPANRNADGVRHAAVHERQDGTVVVGFEDSEGAGDRDFNDAVVLLRGVSIARRCALRAPLTATAIRIGNHRRFVRVVADFSGTGALAARQLAPVDSDPLRDGAVTIALRRPSTRIAASATRSHGVRVRITRGADGLELRLRTAPRRFPSARSFTLRRPERLVVDLRKHHRQPSTEVKGSV